MHFYGFVKLCALLVVSFVYVPLESAWAWGPATHLHYGTEILNQLHLIPPVLADLFSKYSKVYLYGTISADIVLAKKFGKDFQHCHHWHNGFSLLDSAQTDRQKAFVWGYLSHLAADCISHNCFVPSHMLLSHDKKFLNHMYWELRFDQKVSTPRIISLFEELAKDDYEDCDRLFEENIKVRLLNFAFNKQIFKKILILQSVKQWQGMLQKLQESQKWQLTDETVKGYQERSLAAVLDLLNHRDKAEITKYDPIGKDRHQQAGAYRKIMRSKAAFSDRLLQEKIKSLSLLSSLSV